MKKIGGMNIEISFKISEDQVKALALTTAGDISAVREALGKMVLASLNQPRAKDRPYLKWVPTGYFDDEEYNWFWKKHNESPWRNLLAMQELAQHQYGVLDRLADV